MCSVGLRRSMTPVRSYILLAMGACLTAGCGDRVPIGSSQYVLFSPATLPDGHPGTVLRYKGKDVWPSVHSGYFHDSPAEFYRDGMLVFVGSVPTRKDLNYDAQLFAIRGAGPPVLISQRAVHLPLTNSYYIEHVAPVGEGFRVETKFWKPSGDKVTNTISWIEIAGWLKEAESVPLNQMTPAEAFRLLP